MASASEPAALMVKNALKDAANWAVMKLGYTRGMKEEHDNIRTAHKYGKLPSDCFVLVAIFRVQSSLNKGRFRVDW